jgi:hypothetical protein
MKKEKEPKLSFNSEEEMMGHVELLQQLDFLESQDEIEPVEDILVDSSDEHHRHDLRMSILRNNKIDLDDGGLSSICMCSTRALKLAATLISVVIKGAGSCGLIGANGARLRSGQTRIWRGDSGKKQKACVLAKSSTTQRSHPCCSKKKAHKELSAARKRKGGPPAQRTAGLD